MAHHTTLMTQLFAEFLLQFIQYGDSTYSVNLSYQNLVNVPYIDAEWIHVSIDDNIISEIGPNGIAPATNLLSISLENNRIKVIHDDAFASCVGLYEVWLTNNYLMTLPAHFGPKYRVLSNLHVGKNENLSVPQSYFSRYVRLYELDISYTSILIHDWEGLEHLERLNIDGLNYIPNLSGHPKLMMISAKNLQLRDIPNSYISNLPGLIFLEFNGAVFQSSPVPSNISTNTQFLVLMLTGSSLMTSIEDMTLTGPTIMMIEASECPLHCGPGLCWYSIEKHRIYMTAICVTPNKFDGEDLNTLSPLDLRCYEGTEMCRISIVFRKSFTRYTATWPLG